ncbi:hypothetical protein BH10PSE15_BH10PSE15_03560 [soil metagenome]
MSIATIEYPAPWRAEWTRFSESVGYGSRTRILAANGNHVITVGDGTLAGKALQEDMAQAIVAAANCAVADVEPPKKDRDRAMPYESRSGEDSPVRYGI